MEHDRGGDEFAPFLIRDAEHGGFSDGRMLEEHRLHLRRIDVLATGDDNVLDAIENEEEAVGIAIADVSGPEIAVSKGPRRFLAILPVAACDILTARDQFAGFAGRDFPSRLVDDPHIYPGACP